ncbi:hypothetical protein PTKIN_Ptkin10aG0064400 [Pterospermum kingtungense]
MPILIHNLKRSKLVHNKNLMTSILYWNNKDQIKAVNSPFDMAIVAEVVYIKDSVGHLVGAIEINKLIRNKPTASNQNQNSNLQEEGENSTNKIANDLQSKVNKIAEDSQPKTNEVVTVSQLKELINEVTEEQRDSIFQHSYTYAKPYTQRIDE